MSTADLMEDGFPHGSREGFERGCRSGGACMGPLEGLPTCKDAFARSRSDMHYRRRIDAGMSVQAIAAEDRADAEAAGPPKSAKEKAAAKSEYDHPVKAGVAASVEPVYDGNTFSVDEPVDQVDDVDETVEDSELLEVDDTALDVEAEPVSLPPSSPSTEQPAIKKGRLSGADLHQIHEQHVAGRTDAEIAAAIGRNEPTVTSNLEKMGLTPRPSTPAEVVEKPAPKPKAPKAAEPVDAVREAEAERRVDDVQRDLAEAIQEVGRLGDEVERLQGELDAALADVEIERTAQTTLNDQVGSLTAQRIQADELRLDAERDASTAREELLQLQMKLDVVATTPKGDPAGAGLAKMPPAPVAGPARVEFLPSAPAELALQIQPTEGGVSVRMQGGEPLELQLDFANGALGAVAVKVGA